MYTGFQKYLVNLIYVDRSAVSDLYQSFFFYRHCFSPGQAMDVYGPSLQKRKIILTLQIMKYSYFMNIFFFQFCVLIQLDHVYLLPFYFNSFFRQGFLYTTASGECFQVPSFQASVQNVDDILIVVHFVTSLLTNDT